MKRFKKGFTIVELVIVIAVIGILSAILVPTFINLSSKAKDSSDKSLVTNLNTSLRVAEAEDNYKPKTMTEMFEILSDQNYKMNQFVTKTDNDLLYNLVENRFYLSNDEKVVSDANKCNYWKIYDDVPDYEDQTYSIYLNNDLLDSEITVQVGIDLGSNNNIPSVTYEREAVGTRKVTIRTNSGDLHIDAENDEIYHYGSSNDILLHHVASSSYYAYASASFVSISSGRIVIEPDTVIDGLYIKENGVTIAQADNAILPKITRGEDVTSIKIQTTNEEGAKNKESIISIDGGEVSSTGNVPSAIIDTLTPELSTSYEEKDSRFAAKYDCRIGEEIEDDESNYYVSLQDAIDTFSTAAVSAKIYLLRDVTVTSSLTISDTNTEELYHYIYLQGFSIIGDGCTPIAITALKKAFYIYGDGGSIIGDATHPCITNATNFQITVSSVNTVGGFVSSSTNYYFCIDNGNHTLCSFEGERFHLDTPASNSIYDCDLSSVTNPYRNVVEDNGDGTYTLRRITTQEQSDNGWTKISNGATNYTFEKYDTINNFISHADSRTISMKLLVNFNENIDTTNARTLTINSNKKTFTGILKTKGAITLNSGSKTGTFDITQLKCTKLTINANINVTIRGGSNSGATNITGNNTTVTLAGGTYKSVAIDRAKTDTLIITGGTFNNSLSFGTTEGTNFSVSVRGGTYKTEAVYDTFKDFIADGYVGGKDSGKSTYSVKEEA